MWLCQIGPQCCLSSLCIFKPHLHPIHPLNFKRRHFVKALFHGTRTTARTQEPDHSSSHFWPCSWSSHLNYHINMTLSRQHNADIETFLIRYTSQIICNNKQSLVLHDDCHALSRLDIQAHTWHWQRHTPTHIQYSVINQTPVVKFDRWIQKHFLSYAGWLIVWYPVWRPFFPPKKINSLKNKIEFPKCDPDIQWWISMLHHVILYVGSNRFHQRFQQF